MTKTKAAFLFPGQGAQTPGMGKSLYDRSSKAKELMDSACGILGFDILAIMFGEDADALRRTEVTQPAVFLHSTALALSMEDFRPDMVAGHSLGEFSALVASGAMSFEDGLRLVSIRAREMQRCCENHPGTMAAVIALDDDVVRKVCDSVDGIVIPANFNTPGQVVISGEVEAVGKACVALKEAGAKRALPLSVGGAFHSPLMEEARTALAEAIGNTRFRTPVCPVYQNVDGRPQRDPETIKENLLRQLTSPVRWTDTVRNMLGDGAGSFTELGPGTALQGMVKRIAAAEGVEVEINGNN